MVTIIAVGDIGEKSITTNGPKSAYTTKMVPITIHVVIVVNRNPWREFYGDPYGPNCHPGFYSLGAGVCGRCDIHVIHVKRVCNNDNHDEGFSCHGFYSSD